MPRVWGMFREFAKLTSTNVNSDRKQTELIDYRVVGIVALIVAGGMVRYRHNDG